MKTISKIFTISALAFAFGATSALAQTALLGIEAIDDRITEIEDAAAEDLARSEDASRFGNPEFRPGLSGSAALTYSGTVGATDSQDLSIGARLRYAEGLWVQTIGVVLDYSETDGVRTKEDVFAVYDANRYFNDQFYGFVLGRVKSDGLATTAGDTRTDAFIGVGPGYRIVNTPDVTWRVQAGIGVSYLKDGLGDSVTETGYIVSSRAFYKFNENLFLTNDTDILSSDTALRIDNDFGVSIRMTDAMSTRLSYLTDYNDSRTVKTENKVGVSLVFGF
ncbi:YdiY family protein [Phaeovulum sp.]|uniref:DUF481 domain-containing protein n=1 Tax=Phaeovulum sp. TaxID=2934796 RepID=UPI00356708B6